MEKGERRSDGLQQEDFGGVYALGQVLGRTQGEENETAARLENSALVQSR